jgi:plastocyanin
MKHEIMWWMSRLTIMITSIFLSMSLAAQAYAAEIQMGKDGMLVFAPCELTINVEDTFHQAGDYHFQCDPHAGAGMKGVIHVQ